MLLTKGNLALWKWNFEILKAIWTVFGDKWWLAKTESASCREKLKRKMSGENGEPMLENGEKKKEHVFVFKKNTSSLLSDSR